MSPIAMSPAPMSTTLVPGAVTVMADVPVLPSQVAVTLAEPTATPLTSPLPSTVALVMLSLDQVIVRPGSGVPVPLLGVAVSCTVLPVATLAVAGETSTEATATAFTVMADVPVLPSQVAVTLAKPG